MKIVLEISDDTFNLLLAIHSNGNAEYIDYDFEKLEDFYNANIYDPGDIVPLKSKENDDYYLSRNFGGTLHLIRELEEIGMVNIVENPTLAFGITHIGTMVVRNHIIDKIIEE